MTAEEQRAVAETRALRSVAFREHLAAASALLAGDDLQHASERIAAAMELRPDDPEARAVQASINQALEQRGAPRTPDVKGHAPKPDAPRGKPGSRRKRPADGESDLLEG